MAKCVVFPERNSYPAVTRPKAPKRTAVPPRFTYAPGFNKAVILSSRSQ